MLAENVSEIRSSDFSAPRSGGKHIEAAVTGKKNRIARP
jgi:hypothetical protein